MTTKVNSFESTYKAVVVDSYVEDIEFVFLAEPDLLDAPAHRVVEVLCEKSDETADVVETASRNGTQIFVNDDEVSPGALGGILGACAR